MGYVPPPPPRAEYLDTDSPIGVRDPHNPESGTPVVSQALQAWVLFAVGVLAAWLVFA